MRPFHILFLIAAGSLMMYSCQQRQQAAYGPSAVLLQDLNIVRVTSGDIMESVHVVVDSGRIAKILTEAPDPAAFSAVVDGKGGYLLPGLTEMHAHIPSPPATDAYIENTLFLYLSNGITTIRGMLGHPLHLELREAASRGEILSPRIFTSSPSLNGNTVPDGQTASASVRQYASEGYDFLKIHPGIRRPVFDTLVATARTEGIPFAGHVPVDVGIRHALESGYATIDHVDGYLEGLVPESAGVSPEENGFFGFNFTDLADTSRIRELTSLSRAKEVWVVPTQSLFERWFAPTLADSMLAQPEMQYMPEEILANWKRVKDQYMADPSWDPEIWERFDRIRLQLIKALSEEGYGLLLGSDAPQLFNVPGFSIHHEIDGMQRAGLSNAEILRMGTLYPAQFFGIDAEIGTIEEGKKAEFILLAGNPLEDLDALKELEGVMRSDTWVTKDEIEARLQEISQN